MAEKFNGALFKNERKQTEAQPDYNGICEIAGTEYQIGGWLKTSKAGKPYMSLSFSIDTYKKQEEPVAAAAPVATAAPF